MQALPYVVVTREGVAKVYEVGFSTNYKYYISQCLNVNFGSFTGPHLRSSF